MHGFIVVTPHRKAPASSDLPLPLLEIAGRPVLQRVIESMVELGVRSIDLAIQEDPAAIEALLGDGTRWGLSLRYHLPLSGRSVYDILGRIPRGSDDQRTLLVHTDHLVPAGERLHQSEAERGITLFCTTPSASEPLGTIAWSGWASVPTRWLRNLASAADRHEVYRRLLRGPGPRCAVMSSRIIPLRDGFELLQANTRVLTAEPGGHPVSGQLRERGVRVGRGASIHPDAVIEGPAFIGEDVRIAEGCRIGPGTVIGDRCVIDRHATLRQSLVSPDSYVGEALDLQGHFVLQDRIYDIHLEDFLPIQDPTIADRVSLPGTSADFGVLAGRAMAAGAVVALTPLIALLAWRSRAAGQPLLVDIEEGPRMRGGPHGVVPRRPGRSLGPAARQALRRLAGARSRLAHGLGRLVSGCLDVLAGRRQWIGPRPGHGALPGSEAPLPGVVGMADLVRLHGGTPEDEEMADQLQGSMSGPQHDLGLLLGLARFALAKGPRGETGESSGTALAM